MKLKDNHRVEAARPFGWLSFFESSPFWVLLTGNQKEDHDFAGSLNLRHRHMLAESTLRVSECEQR